MRSGRLHEVHTDYHDRHYGFPLHHDDELFGRLILEINQAGLSWETILKKQASFRQAYAGFRIAKVARFGDPDVARLLQDAGIIRNRLKVAAAIENAQRVLTLQKQHGSFAAWLDSHHPLTRLHPLALGAVPVAATIVGDRGEAAQRVLAARNVPAEDRRAAVLDGAHHLQLRHADVPTVGVTPSGAVVAEDIRDLQT